MHEVIRLEMDWFELVVKRLWWNCLPVIEAKDDHKLSREPLVVKDNEQ